MSVALMMAIILPAGFRNLPVDECSVDRLSMPYFSIVIPTYNRAHLLPMALKSVLQQTFEDFEIVVSNGGSTDNTGEVVRAFDDPRIRYLESSVRLSAGDNYQTGLDNAKGEYITFLSDDDAYSPGLLESAKQVIDDEGAEFVGYPVCRYYHDDLFDQGFYIDGNTLYIPPYDGTLTRFSSTEAMNQVKAQHGISSDPPNPKFVCPYLANNVYHRSIFDRLKKVKTKLFHSVPADLYLAMAVFFVVENYHCLDLPLHIWSNWAGSASLSPDRSKNSVRQHYEKLLNGRSLEFTPLKFPLALNCAVNAILEASRDYGPRHSDTEVEWAGYFVTTYIDLMSLKRSGVSVEAEIDEFWSVLSQQPESIQKAVRSQVSGPLFQLKEASRKFPTLSRRLKKLMFIGRVTDATFIKGDEAGFNNVLESSAYAGKLFGRTLAQGRSV